MKKYAIIVAGGVGQRLNADIPKQFLLLKNKPILLHSIHQFIKAEPDIHIILAIRPSLIELWHETAQKYHFDHSVTLSMGGKERFDTVKNALEFVPEDSCVAIHDSVRPLVSIETIQNSFKFAEIHHNAVPAITPSDSVRILSDNCYTPFNRNSVLLIQTPQTFFSKDIKQAYQQAYQAEFTDDATVYEKFSGKNIFLFEGNRENIKITYQNDLAIAHALIS